MLKLLTKLFRAAIYALLLAILLLVCRFVAVWLAWPAWSSIVLWLILIVLYIAAKQGLASFRRRREERLATKILEADREASRETTAADPELAARMRLTWKSGLSFLANSRLGKFDFAYKLPWYISLGDDDSERDGLLRDISVKGAQAQPLVDNPEFSWRFARRAVWLDLADSMGGEPDERWRLFVSELVRNRGKAPLGGVVAMLDAGRLVGADEEGIKAEAAGLRQRLDHLIKITGARIPVYVLVNHIDSLYGMRSLVANLGHDELEQPFGAFRTNDSEPPGAFAARVPREAAKAIAVVAFTEDAQSGDSLKSSSGIEASKAAAFQAPDELPRLSAPLALFCREAFGDNPYQMVPILRGVFFGSTGSSRPGLPSLLTSIPSFKPESEDNPPHANKRWFFPALLDEWIPGDPAPVKTIKARRHIRAITVHSGLAALLVCTLLLCWAMTLSFFEGRRALRSTSVPADILRQYGAEHNDRHSLDDIGADASPTAISAGGNGSLLSQVSTASSYGDIGRLDNLLDQTMRLELRNRQWYLPRFGMNEPLELERDMRKAFCELYYHNVMLPSIDRIRAQALEAADSNRPATIGNSLLILMAMRHGLANRLAGKGVGSAIDYTLSLMDTGDSRADLEARTRLEMFLQWTRTEHWMSDVSRMFLNLERQIINNAMSGNVMAWLPDWIDGLNGVSPVNTASAWNPVSIPGSESARRTVRGAWTLSGYNRAERFLREITLENDEENVWGNKQETLLAEYRQAALAGWKNAANELWRDFQHNIDDGALPTLIRQVASGDGPTARMNRLLAQNLLPMYEKVEKLPPDIEWLRLANQFMLSPGGLTPAAAGESSVLSRVADRVSGVVRKISSDDNIALLSKNIGFSTGNEALTALENWNKLLKAFGDVTYLAGSKDSCLDLVSDHYFTTGAVNAALSAAADASAGASATAGPRENGDAQAADISKDPFGDGKIAADDLNSYLTGHSGSSAWVGISPKAAYNYLRYLTVRQAAVHLDAAWIQNVFNPALVLTGTDDERMAALFGPGGLVAVFLGETSDGFWRMANGKMQNAEWDGLAFMFNNQFLSFCDTGLTNISMKKPEKVGVTFRVDAVTVDAGARERPNQVEFFWSEGGAVQSLLYRNYVTGKVFEWNMDKHASAGIRIVFPSVTLVKTFDGYKALGEFVTRFRSGKTLLHLDDFPGEADILSRLGVSGISIRSSMQNHEQLLKFMEVEIPVIPSSIITSLYRH